MEGAQAYSIGMRAILGFGLLALLSAPVWAAETCEQLASVMSAEVEGFPATVPDTSKDLVTWRASCAETPPTGEGDVRLLCETNTKDGLPVFYWLKQDGERVNAGFASCVY